MNKLKKMVEMFPNTHFWNDSCSINELKYSIENGGVGATTNPVIVKNVLDKELDGYKEEIIKTIKNNPLLTEDEIAWLIIEKMAVDGAELLEPLFDPATGKGRISIQTNTKYFRNTKKLVEQGTYFNGLAPNMQVKAPATSAGIDAFEELTYRGVSVNATVSFSATQAIAIGEAVERGLKRRTAEGMGIDRINPVCTIMVGRLDDWLKEYVGKQNISIDPGALNYAGIACVKKAYRIFKERSYKTKILVAAYRSHLQWEEFIGGDIIMTIPYKYQVQFNKSEIEIKNNIDKEVNCNILDELMKLPDFVKAYDKMDVTEFDKFGPVVKTLNQFAEGYDGLVKIIRGFMFH